MVSMPDILVDVIDKTARFDENCAHSHDICGRKSLVVSHTNFNKVISIFKEPQKP